jgi:hypothetical protein
MGMLVNEAEFTLLNCLDVLLPVSGEREARYELVRQIELG